MTTTIKLTETQQELIKVASYRPDGNIEPLPATLRGGARKKVIDGLLARELIFEFHHSDSIEYRLTEVGYAAVGRKPKATAPTTPETVSRAGMLPTAAGDGQENHDTAQSQLKTGVEGKPRLRENSKQATVIEMLRRPNGVTINEICEATEWQSHTVRGFFAGALKKKLGLDITSFKDSGASRVYRIL
jgi:hypothetical protein